MALDPMIQFLGIKQLSYPAQIGLDGEALVPSSALTAVDVRTWCALFAKSQIGERNRLTVIAHRQRTKGVIGFIGRGPSPVDYFTRIIDQPRQLDADNPAAVGNAFLANLALATPFTPRMDQFNAIGINYGKERRLRQQFHCQRSIIAQQAQQTREMGQSWKEVPIVGLQPAIESSIASTF